VCFFGQQENKKMGADFHEKLAKLAKLAVRFGVNLQPGQILYFTAPTAGLELARLVTEEAYRAGAEHVLPFFLDDEITLAKYRHGSDAAIGYAPAFLSEALAEQAKTGKLARLGIYGDTPSLLAAQPPQKVSKAAAANATASRPLMVAITTSTNWNIVACATPAWAAEVFPDLPEGQALEKLWDLIFKASRIDEDDPVAAWERDFAELRRRKSVLNQHRFGALHFEGGGTDLTIGLADNHIWCGGDETLNGFSYAPNLPTEEVFSMPHRDRVNGRAVFTKPAVIAGTRVEGLVVEFKDGKAVSITAEKGEAVVRDYFTSDEGASHLGEVALVSNSSPVAQTDTLFLNTLFDENAACHIAFGQAYSINIDPSADKEAAGMNSSKIHMDCMIGHGQLQVTGITTEGSRVPVMKNGEFVI
jgi:aminopeptidase